MLKEKDRFPRDNFPPSVREGCVSLIALILFLISGPGLLSGQTDPLDVPFREPLYVLHLSWTITAEWGKVENDDYMLHPSLPDQNGVILRGAEMGWYQSGAEYFAGPFTTPRQVCEAIKGLPIGKTMFIRNVITCPAAPPPPPPEPKPEPEPEPAARPEPAREPEPQPEEKEKSPCDLEAELTLHRQAIKDAITLETAGRSATTELAILQKQIERCRLAFPELIAALIADKEFDPFAKGLFSAAMLSGFQSTHKQLCEKQDAVVAEVVNSHRTFLGDLAEKIAGCQCPEVKQAFLELKTGLEDEWCLGEVKLYHASGQREKFKALARQLLNQNKHTYQLNILLGQDSVQNGEVGSALFAFRDAHKAFIEEMKKLPQDKIPKELTEQEANIKELVESLEIAFLRAVDSKVLGDAATIRDLVNKEIERGESWWNVVSGGVVTSLSGYDSDWLWWVPWVSAGSDPRSLPTAVIDSITWQQPDSQVEGRADSMGVILSEAAVEHLGLMTILRFREAGKTLQEIKGADNATVIRWVSEEGLKKGQNKVISPQRGINLRKWIYHGFQNPDIIRLMTDSREEFERYEGRPYYSPEEFEQTWGEWLVDFFLNPLMVASIFAPYAKVSSPEVSFLWTKVTFMTGEQVAKSSNFVQWAANALRVPQLIQQATATNTVLARQIQAVIKWNAEASLLKKIFVEGMIQTGAVELATAVGGLPGQVVAQVLVTLGVGDLDLAVGVLQNAGVSGAAAGQLARSLKNILEESTQLRTQAQIVGFREMMAKALSQLDADKPLEDLVKSELKTGAQKIDTLLSDLGGKAESDLMRMQLHQLELTASGLRALADGKVPMARYLIGVIDDADASIIRAAKQLQDGINVVDVAKPMRVHPMAEPELVPMEGDKVTSTEKACKRLSQLWKDHDATFKAADQALREGNTEAALRHYSAAMTRLSAELEQAAKQGKEGDVLEKLKELMLNIESYAVVKDISRSSRHIKKFGSIANNPIVAEILEPDATPIKKEINRIFQQIKDQVKDLPEHQKAEQAKVFLERAMPRLKTSEGALTKDSPRLVSVNGLRYVLKDYTENIQKGKGEMFATRLANKLKIDTPGCAMVTWTDAIDETRFGLIQRFVPDASDLGAVDRGAALAMKKHVAHDRVLSMLLGDHDRRSRNFLLAVTGEPYCIDRGESAIIESLARWGDEITDDTRRDIISQLERRYKTFYMSEMKTKWPIIEAIDLQITFQDLDEMIGQVERLTKEDFQECLRGLYDEGSREYEQALETLMTRQGALRNLFSGQPSGMGASAERIRGSGFLKDLKARLSASRLWDSLKPVFSRLQPAFVACP